MGFIDELVPLLKKLRLSGVLQSLELRVRQAVDEQLSYEEYLIRLVGERPRGGDLEGSVATARQVKARAA